MYKSTGDIGISEYVEIYGRMCSCKNLVKVYHTGGKKTLIKVYLGAKMFFLASDKIIIKVLH